MTTIAADVASDVRGRVDALDWDALDAQLDDVGHAITPAVLTEDECDELAALFDGGRFRSTIDMARHRFGDGRYRYFDHPLPELIAAAARLLLPAPGARSPTAGANGCAATPRRFPADHEELLERCREAGQTRPTPLILRYGPGDWNALHQDLYGDVFFPFQILTVLSRRGADYEGGEFVLLEQRPRAQSRAHVLTPAQGAFVIFPTRERPARGRSRPSPRGNAPRRLDGHLRPPHRLGGDLP